MSSRRRPRYAATLRLIAIAILALSVLLRPVLSSLGEAHELVHDPAGRHLDLATPGNAAHDAREAEESNFGGALHALLHFVHCCGQTSVAGMNHVVDLRPAVLSADPGNVAPVAIASARWQTPFRPPINA